MRITTVFRKFLRVEQLVVEEVAMTEEALELHVRPTWRRRRCGRCGERAPGYDRQPQRRWRHLAWGRVPVYLLYAPWRVECASCGVGAEQVPWALGKSRFTLEFEEMAAYLAQVTDQTRVTQIMGISWQTVGAIVERVVARRLDPERLEGLRRIGVDEFSYRKRHRYLTIVVDHDRRRAVWAREGKSAEVLEEFFKELGSERSLEIKQVTIDMSAGYEKAIRAALPQAEVIFDRFHVQRLASDALDEVRRSGASRKSGPHLLGLVPGIT
jgi:transposase